jgi:hypothetical protein
VRSSAETSQLDDGDLTATSCGKGAGRRSNGRKRLDLDLDRSRGSDFIFFLAFFIRLGLTLSHRVPILATVVKTDDVVSIGGWRVMNELFGDEAHVLRR